MARSPKLRAGGLLESAGFRQGDLKTPQHDEICILLDAYIRTRMDSEIASLKGYSYEVEWERPVVDRRGVIIGNIDLTLKVLRVGTLFDVIHFEVKPVIRSLGDIIRQISKYRIHLGYIDVIDAASCMSYTRQRAFIVVCPDARFEPLLRSQGIGFFRFPFNRHESKLALANSEDQE